MNNYVGETRRSVKYALNCNKKYTPVKLAWRDMVALDITANDVLWTQPLPQANTVTNAFSYD